MASQMPLCLSGILGSSSDLLRLSRRTFPRPSVVPHCTCSSASPPPPLDDEDGTSKSRSSGIMVVLEHANSHLAKAALATAVASLIIFGPIDDAQAAKSGGRAGGQAFQPAPPPRVAPRIDNSRRSNIYINPPSFVAPPLYGGYGSPFFGGWGWSPFSFFAPGPSIAVGVGGGFNIILVLLLVSFVGGIINSFRRRDDDD